MTADTVKAPLIPEPGADAGRANDVPDDLQFIAGFIPAPLEDQLRLARHLLAQWREANEHRTTRERGHWSMHPLTYAKGLHVRRSLIHTLLQTQNTTSRSISATGDQA